MTSSSPPPRRVLVTGAASGIGLAIAHRFARAGHHLFLADRDPKVMDLASSMSTLGAASCSTAVMDLNDPDQVLALAKSAQTAQGGIDILVNNAGISPKRQGQPPKPTDIDLQEWEQVMRVNVTAPFLLTRELVVGMTEHRFGRIINTASRAGRTFVGPAGTHYAASKAALLGMTRHFAGLYAAQGVTANCVAPGRVETPLSNTSAPSVLAAAVAAIPAQRMGTPDEIAATVEFLASDAASYITGTCIDVNGGIFMA
ncbi:MAG: hypothetical protein RI949_1570 [Pseudomonadota bacterium]